MNLYRVQSISEMHKLLGLQPPKHPLITIFNWEDVNISTSINGESFDQVTMDFYMISQKEISCGDLRYGRNTYDFEEGVLMFVAPGQVITAAVDREATGWALFFNPDLIRKTHLGQKFSEYNFFSYDVNEALHLSEKEKKTLTNLVEQIKNEYSENIDVYTQDLIVSQLELLLNYATRFYGRQFITRTTHNSDLVSRFEFLLADYFDSKNLKELGLPGVKYFAEELGMSPDYLSDMLKQETGKNTQEHIHYIIIDRAKTKLLNSSNSISEIAYTLGFEYPQYFSKLFKQKTGMTPVEFRKVS